MGRQGLARGPRHDLHDAPEVGARASARSTRSGRSSKGVPPHWNIYVAVASADAAAKKAKDLGGKILMEPFDVMDVGRMAIIQDQQGATFSVWEPKKHIGSEVVNEPGTLCWAELDTTDTEVRRELLHRPLRMGGQARGRGGQRNRVHRVAAWREIDRRDDDDSEGVGTRCRRTGSSTSWSPTWTRRRRRLRRSGGTVIVPPTDIPKTGRFAVMQDPQRATFAIFKPEM